jgi:hypothetical protein
MEHVSGNQFDLDSVDGDLHADDDAQMIALLGGDLHCPLCDRRYDSAETRVVRERAGLVTLAVQCHRCGTGSLVAIERTPQARVTELTAVERAFFAYLPPLDAGDVRRMRAVLANHRGDLRDLI